MLLFPALLRAQTVYVTVNGTVAITSVPPRYYGNYVLQQTDFGFLWLDTAALAAGHAQAVSKCGLGFPPADSSLYAIGDCWSITSIASSGGVVLVRMLSGQCLAQRRECDGPRDDGHYLFTFGLGAGFPFLSDHGTEIPDMPGTTDPQGRTWIVEPTDTSGINFVWHSSGIPSSPPFADAIGTNLSAGDRTDKTNYYGDRWQLKDISSGATSVLWDFNYAGSFATDESGPELSEGTVIGYFPCDPAGVPGGDIRSGANCRQSLGLSNPPLPASYRFALRSANSFGTSTNTFSSAALAVGCPQAIVAAYTGFTGTCAKSGGMLTLPAGGNADASNSKGNLAEASFSWIFNFPSGSGADATGPVVPVPNGAIAFTLTIAFPGGYQATASGGVTLTSSLIAAFSTQNPVVRSSSFNLTNEMVKASTTTLNSVDSLILPGACGAPPPMSPSPLASSFLLEGGLASLTAPGSVGDYCVYLKYNYTEGGFPSSQVASRPLTVTDWAPTPSIGIYLDGSGTQAAPFFGVSFYLAAGTNYYFLDEEPAPPAGTPYPGARWSLVSPTGETALGSSATQVLGPARFSKTCTTGCFLKVTVGSLARQIAVNIASCSPNATTLCLNGGRFGVAVTWTTPDGRSGQGRAVGVTGDTGYFWFFTSGNVEMIVKVVDGRAVNSRFWVFAGGLTNVDVVLSVVDVQTGTVAAYHNPQGVAFQPIQDTGTFLESSTLEPADTLSSAGRLDAASPFSATQTQSAKSLCTANATTLCLNNGRFQVQARWTTRDGAAGLGQAVSLTGDTGYFWFFSPNNVEMVVKVVNGCGFNSGYWTFAGGLTDVNVVMTVTDTQTDAVKTYTNPQSIAFQPIQDTSAFPSCP